MKEFREIDVLGTIFAILMLSTILCCIYVFACKNVEIAKLKAESQALKSQVEQIQKMMSKESNKAPPSHL